jgi:hypothetical protein
LTCSTQDSGVSLRRAPTRMLVEPRAMQAPHSPLFICSVPVIPGNHLHIRIWAVKVPRSTNRKYWLWRNFSKTLKSLLPTFLQLISLKSCKKTKVLKM